MDIHAELKKIYRALPDRAVISEYPDLPSSIMGPDILIGFDGTLTALFLLRSIEQRQPHYLIARRNMCRLTLPEHTQMLFIQCNESDDLPDTVAPILFDRILPLNEIVKNTSVLFSETTQKSFQNEIREVKIKNSEIAQRALSLSDLALRYDYTQSQERPHAYHSFVYFFKQTQNKGGRYFISKRSYSFYPNVSDSPSAGLIYSESKKAAFQIVKRLITGIFVERYNTHSSVPALLNEDLVPTLSNMTFMQRYDPYRIRRAAAFCGLFFASTRRPDLFPNFVQRAK